jgi:predicted RNase H-like nuclease (RuvC/YqgF family)
MLGNDATVARLKEQISVLEDQSRTCEDEMRVLRTNAETLGSRTERNTCTSRRARERKSCVRYFTSSIGYHILATDSLNNTLVKRVQ